MTSLICTICANEYVPKVVRKDSKYCSTKCKDRASVLKRRGAGYGNSTSPCNIQGCTRMSRWTNGNGPCSMHYRRIRLTGDPGPAAAVRGGRTGIVPCVIDGCDRTYFAHGLCNMHYTRKRVTGDAGEAELRRKPVAPDTVWRHVEKNGYVYLRLPGEDRRIYEHRLVMEQHLGRPLWPDETVHHVNGQRGDNRLANLELWSSFQPAGQRVEDKIAYAREILARYT